MRKYLAVGSAVFALALTLAVLVNAAYAGDRPAKRTVDFSALLNGTTSSLVKTGVVVKIQAAAIAKDGTITIRATIVYSDGNPLHRLGVATNGPASIMCLS